VDKKKLEAKLAFLKRQRQQNIMNLVAKKASELKMKVEAVVKDEAIMESIKGGYRTYLKEIAELEAKLAGKKEKKEEK
jgi:hypothetical protein